MDPIIKKFNSSADLKEHLKRFKMNKIHSRTRKNDLKNFVAMDTETTGLDATQCEVIDVGAVRFRDGKPVESFSILLKPHAPIPALITEINHITDEMVEGQPYFAEIVAQLEAFVGSDAVVGQNLCFDLGFLVNYGMEFPEGTRFYDTMLIGREKLRGHFTSKYDPASGKWTKTENAEYDIENHKLGTLCDYFGVELIDAHRAENDALATGKLFVRMAEHYGLIRTEE